MNNSMYIFLFIIILFSSCSTSHPVYRNRPDFAMYDAIERKNQRYFAKKGLAIYETGGGNRRDGYVVMAGYGTAQDRFTTIEEARPFFRQFVTEYMASYNKEKKLRPYMRDFPFVVKNFELYILFMDERDEPLTKPYIGCVQLMDGSILYMQCTQNPFKRELIHVESFE